LKSEHLYLFSILLNYALMGLFVLFSFFTLPFTRYKECHPRTSSTFFL
jgi:hypothetical protein